MNGMRDINRIEAVAGLAAAALLAAGCLVVLRPFVSAILWAAVVTYTTWPLLIRLDRRLGGRRSLAAFTMTALITVVMVLPFVAVGFTLAQNVSRIGEMFRFLQGGLPTEAPGWVRHLPWIAPLVEHAWPGFVENTELVSNALKSAGLKAGAWLLRHGLDFGKGILQLGLSVVIAFFLYRDGERLTERIASGAQRIAGDVSQRLLSVAGSTVRNVVYGSIGGALAQAFAAIIGFAIAGLPSPFFLGLLTFLMAMIPSGPPFVWIPAALWLFHEGRIGWGIFMAVWGVFAISGIDNLLRPYLISRGSKQPFPVVLLGALGGVLAFGFIGLFLGPVLLAVGFALVREFTDRGARPAEAALSAEGEEAEPRR
jgi:predicted PurR-regulated permease PerM